MCFLWGAISGNLPNAPRSYTEGAKRLWAGETPYQPPTDADWFKYSPAFAVFYHPLTELSAPWHSFIWGALNIFLFWAGVSAWFSVRKDWPWMMWLALLFCSMELDGPVRHLQINAALTGLILLGVFAYRKECFALSGGLLAVGTNVKLLPVGFLLALALKLRSSFLLSALLITALLLVLPVAVVGWEKNLIFHKDWAALILSDAGGKGILDIGTALSALGIPLLAEPVRWGVLLTSGLVLFSIAGKCAMISWGPWISVGLGMLLLVSPRTEQPTFVLMAPAFLFLVEPLASPRRHPWQLRFWGLGVLLVTIMYNDIWPRFLWNPREHGALTKPFGILLLWGLGVYQYFQSKVNDRTN